MSSQDQLPPPPFHSIGDLVADLAVQVCKVIEAADEFDAELSHEDRKSAESRMHQSKRLQERRSKMAGTAI
ncbi:hypothetical protein [Paracoccus laeviglucosivorans]|uniref:Uncharacterized protein n=1 Tax=Paracoccus laeviglucosivorans TaxID=1197861 RepID=A0A521DF60_9RHOB|nr:hypothetical protein [Paracoccus laeviglucosivorans]SMO69580.1 hypothetical protein SAMN06265221_107121 [Paracoccus laeviglucosivorans]